MSDVGGAAGTEGTANAPAPAVVTREVPQWSREARRVATWKVGSLHPTAVKVLTVLGFAIPVGAYLAMLAHYQVNAILADEWTQVQVIIHNYKHFPTWSSLWGLHTDNRMLFPNLMVIGLAHTVSFNIEVEEYLSALMLFGSVALLIWAHKRRTPATPLFFYCPVAFVMLTLAQWQNTLWGFQMAWYLVLLSLALSVVLLDWPRMTWPILVCAVLVAVVGSYSSVQGLLVWPVGVLLLYYRRRPAWTLVSWIATGLVTSGLYFSNYHSLSVNSPLYVVRHPFSGPKLFLFALGDIVGIPAPGGPVGQEHAFDTPAHAAVMIFGAAILVLAVFVVARWGIRRDSQGGTPIGIVLIVYGFLFDYLVSDSRALFGYVGVSQSRYTTYDELVLVGIYFTALSRASSPSHGEGRVTADATASQPQPLVTRPRGALSLIDRGAVARLALVAMAIQLVLSVHYGLAGARSQQQADIKSLALMRNIDHESSLTVYSMDIGESPQMIREDAAFLREHHLGPYG